MSTPNDLDICLPPFAPDLLDLFAAALGGRALTPGQAADLELIRRSIKVEESGGGHMVELLQALLNSPLEVENRC